MPHPLFQKILEIAQLAESVDGETLNKLVHETLSMACQEGLQDRSDGYGGIFAQVDLACKLYDVPIPDRIAIQTLRRNSNRGSRFDKNDFPYDLRALSIFVSYITGEDIPVSLLEILPKTNRPYKKTEKPDENYIRCIVRRKDEEFIYVTVEPGPDDQLLAVDCSAEHLNYIMEIAKEGMQLNLLDSTINETGNDREVRIAVPRLIIVEPDYLIDISSIAACFKEYGHHALNYTIERLRQKSNTVPILLGNFAGSALDGMVNHEADFDFVRTMRDSFKRQALEYSSCGEFNGDSFKRDATIQSENIKTAVDSLFSHYNRSKTILEPSFVCERLGLQGRVDMMTTDLRLLIEQKSGRNVNIEFGKNKERGTQLEPHYVQLLLYYAVLKYNFNTNHDNIDAKLLYSKYPPDKGLVTVAFYNELFREAIKVRNEIVATDIRVAQEGFASILPSLTPDTLNTEKVTSKLYNNYQLPQIEAVTEPLRHLSPLEREYFCRMMTFVYKERLISKVGAQEGVNSSNADLWNMPLSEKLETGNIYMGLTVKNKEKSDGDTFDLITLTIPKQGGGFLPNFRRGDMIYLYQYPKVSTPDVRSSILYKGNIKEIHTAELVVALMNGQQNPNIFQVSNANTKELYAVEHASSDMSWNSAICGLHQLMTAPDHRRQLLLGQRQPERDTSKTLTKEYEGGYNDILLKAKQANDYFMLLGPPGTGKTSMALRFIVEEEIASGDGTLLLMAYTNRAVDEICSMLDNAQLDYIRLGNEYSADPSCKSHLLSEIAKGCPKMSAVKQRLLSTRIITGTTSTLMARPYIFDIKTFSLAVIDEASQILEPNIMGLLAVHRRGRDGKEHCRIERFIMIGDHKQLPAVVQQSVKVSSVDSKELINIGLDNCRNSLFERLLRIERKAGRDEFTGVLNRYGRMHPEVADFPNGMFYANERLVPVQLDHQKEKTIRYADIGESDILDTMLRTHRMLFIQSRLCRRPDISDKVNTDEAWIVAQLLYRLRRMFADSFDPAKSIGVIVPYRNQIAMIRQEVEKLGMSELEGVSIDTVERYQGSQRDVIIYSFTVQNTWQLGFLTANCFEEDGRLIDRKLNVALTRARCQMIMTGNESILSANPVFRRMIEYVRSKGGLLEREKLSDILL
ncbi:MAG: AAA domain-containing protein [Prevotella sp.]|nr:AAA domain-containing protein [Prevotella sp.]